VVSASVLTQFASLLGVSEHLAEWGSSRNTDMELEESLLSLFITLFFINGLYGTQHTLADRHTFTGIHTLILKTHTNRTISEPPQSSFL
jgi:hypothetical protein